MSVNRLPGITYLERNLRKGSATLGLVAAVTGLWLGWGYAIPFLALICLAQYAALRRRTSERDEALTQCQIWRARAEVIRVAADERPGANIGDPRTLREGWSRMQAHFNCAAQPFSLALFEVRPKPEAGTIDGLADVVAEALTDTARLEDAIARVDGATFAVLLAGANLHGAVAFIDRVAAAIERHTMGAGGPVFEQVRVGAAAWDSSMRSVMDLLHAADARMPFADEHLGDEAGDQEAA